MTNAASSFLACTLLSAIFVAQPALAEEELKACQVRAMTFNIRYNNPDDGANAWPHRKEIVANLIRQQADLAGLQEAQLDQIEELQALLPEFDWYGVGRDDGQQGGEFCPVFYRRDRFDLLSRDTRWLSETPTVAGSKSWDAAITRLVTIVQLRDRDSGVKFFFINTHFDHVGSIARKESARLIKRSIAALPTGVPVIVTGDFNCTPDQEPYRILTAQDPRTTAGELIDTRSITEAPAIGPDSTWNGFRQVEPGRRIDFILVGPVVKVRAHRTLPQQVDGRFPSDHLPVIADLLVPRPVAR